MHLNMNCLIGHLMAFSVLESYFLDTQANQIPPNYAGRKILNKANKANKAKSTNQPDVEPEKRTDHLGHQAMLDVAYCAGNSLGKDISREVKISSSFSMGQAIDSAYKAGQLKAESGNWTHDPTEFLKQVAEKLAPTDFNIFALGFKIGEIVYNANMKDILLDKDMHFYLSDETKELFTMGCSAGNQADGKLPQDEAGTLLADSASFIQYIGSELPLDARALLNSGFNAGTSVLGDMINEFEDEVQSNINPVARFIYHLGYNVGYNMYGKGAEKTKSLMGKLGLPDANVKRFLAPQRKMFAPTFNADLRLLNRAFHKSGI